MKKIAFLLFTVISVTCFSQAREQQPLAKPIPGTWYAHTPGFEIKAAGNCLLVGLPLQTIGTYFMLSGFIQTVNSGGSTGGGEFTIGVLSLVTGTIFDIAAGVHFGRAGRLMDMYKVSFGPTKNGFGLICKL